MVLLHLFYPILPIPPNLDRLGEETSGWDTLGDEIHQLQQSMPDPENTFIFALRYQDASILAFYTPGKPKTICINRWGRPNAYDYWWNDPDMIGKNAVGISTDAPKHLGRLRQVFASVDTPQRVAIYRNGAPFLRRAGEPPLSEYFIYRAFGFKGGLHWVPEDAADVRVSK